MQYEKNQKGIPDGQKNLQLVNRAYVAAQGFVPELLAELAHRREIALAVKGRLVLAHVPEQAGGLSEFSGLCPAWAQNTWFDPEWFDIVSISDAAAKLKNVQRNWHVHPVKHFRRCALITEKLPRISFRPLVYGEPAPSSPLGAWTLWEANRMLVASRCSSPFPDGEAVFEENRIDPPSRAYLKLWEVFTLLGKYPQAGETCLDLGASPGGWTWVLAMHGATVTSIDRAPLAETVMAMKSVNYVSGSGFGLDPRHAPEVDWLCSDMICYPERLWKLVSRWLKVESAKT